MFLFDTNVISELRRPRTADLNVLAWSRSIDVADIFISVVTVQELEYGILRLERHDAAQSLVLRKWLSATLEQLKARILDVDVAIAERSAQLHVPNPRQYPDALIAATAWVHNLTLITRNVKDFNDMGVPIINPWMPQR